MGAGSIGHCRALTPVNRAGVILAVASLLGLTHSTFGDPPNARTPDIPNFGKRTAIPVAPPVGFVQIVIPPQSDAVVSIPFNPINPSLDIVLAGQLTGSTNLAGADRVLVWDPRSSVYRMAAKMILPISPNDSSLRSGIGDDSVWFEIVNSDSGAETISGPVGDNFRIVPGAGFILCNRQNREQTVRLGGEVVLESIMSLPLPQGLTILGTPFTSAKDVNGTKWSKSCTALSTNMLTMGAGSWVSSQQPDSLNEPRPYPNPFSSSNASVRIANLILDETKAILDIRVADPSVRTLDILIRDLAPTDVVTDLTTGWTLAAFNIPASGKTELHWTDDLSASASASSFKGVRLYLVVRADSVADLDGDGTPDPRQSFCPPPEPTHDIAGKTVPSPSSDPQIADPMPTPPLAKSPPTVVTESPLSKRTGIVYVDIRRGDDRFTGLLDAVTADDGPKKTISSGMKTLASGGTMVIRDGVYGENLRISGKPVRVRIQGKVTIRNAKTQDGK